MALDATKAPDDLGGFPIGSIVRTARVLVGDVRQRLADIADGTVQTCVTSPPYWGLRDYGHPHQIGLETTLDDYVTGLVHIFSEVRRVLSDDGTVWLNLGDSYASHDPGGYRPGEFLNPGGRAPAKQGSGRNRAGTYRPEGLKPKDLIGLPWRIALALQAQGWWLRQDIIWSKPTPMPENVKDRCTKAHEYLFLLSKSRRYRFDRDILSELNGCGRSVWTVKTQPFRGAHFVVMPEALVEPCILAGSNPGDLVLDPFTGSGTVGVVALRHGRDFVGVELNPEYAAIAEGRIYGDAPLMNDVQIVA